MNYETNSGRGPESPINTQWDIDGGNPDWSILTEDANSSNPDWSILTENTGSNDTEESMLAEKADSNGIDWKDWDSLDAETQAAIVGKVFYPNDEFIESRIEKTKIDLANVSPKLVDVVGKMEAEGNITEYLAGLTNVIAETFKIKDVPDIEIIDVVDGAEAQQGGYDQDRNVILIKRGTLLGLPNIIAHELWHAHQYEHRKSDILYDINFDLYRSGKEDICTYKSQLIEREAYDIGKYFQKIVQKIVINIE